MLTYEFALNALFFAGRAFRSKVKINFFRL